MMEGFQPYFKKEDTHAEALDDVLKQDAAVVVAQYIVNGEHVDNKLEKNAKTFRRKDALYKDMERNSQPPSLN